MIRDLLRRVRRWWGPRPRQASGLRVGAHLYISSQGIRTSGWLSPEGQFLSSGDASRFLHRELAESVVGRSANPERDLERLGWVKFSRTPAYTGWHRHDTLTERQRLVIQDWYVREARKWPNWLY
jgi:hypothetical protein